MFAMHACCERLPSSAQLDPEKLSISSERILQFQNEPLHSHEGKLGILDGISQAISDSFSAIPLSSTRHITAQVFVFSDYSTISDTFIGGDERISNVAISSVNLISLLKSKDIAPKHWDLLEDKIRTGSGSPVIRYFSVDTFMKNTTVFFKKNPKAPSTRVKPELQFPHGFSIPISVFSVRSTDYKGFGAPSGQKHGPLLHYEYKLQGQTIQLSLDQDKWLRDSLPTDKQTKFLSFLPLQDLPLGFVLKDGFVATSHELSLRDTVLFNSLVQALVNKEAGMLLSIVNTPGTLDRIYVAVPGLHSDHEVFFQNRSWGFPFISSPFPQRNCLYLINIPYAHDLRLRVKTATPTVEEKELSELEEEFPTLLQSVKECLSALELPTAFVNMSAPSVSILDKVEPEPASPLHPLFLAQSDPVDSNSLGMQRKMKFSDALQDLREEIEKVSVT